MLTTPSRRLSSIIFLAFAYFLLAACGGSSGGGTPPVVTPPDTSPTPFTFAAAEDVEPGVKEVSESVPIEGIDKGVSLTVTVEGGQYKLNDGEFQTEASEASRGDKLVLQGTAPNTPEETQTVRVTVGDYTTTFDVVAASDTGAPEAAFVFPPPMTATEGDTVIVRGTADDEWSEVSRVTLTVTHADSTNDYEVDTENGFATWQKQVTLAPGENTITLQAEDALGNKVGEDERQSVTVVRQEFSEAFPNDEVAIEEPRSLVFDEERDRILVSDMAADRVVAVDLLSGARSVFLEGEVAEDVVLAEPSGLAIDTPRSRLLVGAGMLTRGHGVLGVDLNTKEVTVISSKTIPKENQPALVGPQGLTIDPTDPDQVFVLASGTNNLARLDLATGLRTQVSSNDVPDSGPNFNMPTHILIDGVSGRGLIAQASAGGLLSLDLSTGVREVFLAEGEPDGIPFSGFFALASDDVEQRLFVAEVISEEIWSVDMETREITVLSGEGKPNNYNPMGRIVDLKLDPNEEFLVGVSDQLNDVNVVYSIDLVTGERLILSKPTGDIE